MDPILKALKKVLKDCGSPQVICFFFVPPLLSLLIWSLLLWAMGLNGSVLLDYISPGYQAAHSVGSHLGTDISSEISTKLLELSPTSWDFYTPYIKSIFHIFILALGFILLLTLLVMTSAFISAALIVPLVLGAIQKRHYPDLTNPEKLNSIWSLFQDSLRRSVKIFLIYLFLLVITLPLWLIPGLGLVIPLILNSYLNKEIYPYEILISYATQSEIVALEIEHRRNYFILGMLSFLLNAVPLAFLILPTLTPLMYLHYCLEALDTKRRVPAL